MHMNAASKNAKTMTIMLPVSGVELVLDVLNAYERQ